MNEEEFDWDRWRKLEVGDQIKIFPNPFTDPDDPDKNDWTEESNWTGITVSAAMATEGETLSGYWTDHPERGPVDWNIREMIEDKTITQVKVLPMSGGGGHHNKRKRRKSKKRKSKKRRSSKKRSRRTRR